MNALPSKTPGSISLWVNQFLPILRPYWQKISLAFLAVALISLVLRFYDPTKGRVLADGKDLREFTLLPLREQISLVLQDSLLFSGTIRENIAFGRPDASDEEIVTAARLANAHEFIADLPGGYDSPISERATSLSGGEKQRIAIARAILRDAPILILDEPTSSLDAAAEQAVMEALRRAATGRTTFIIAHRFSTVRLADRIIVLDQGRLLSKALTPSFWRETEGMHFYITSKCSRNQRVEL